MSKYGTVLLHKDRRLRITAEEKADGKTLYTFEVLHEEGEEHAAPTVTTSETRSQP